VATVFISVFIPFCSKKSAQLPQVKAQQGSTSLANDLHKQEIRPKSLFPYYKISIQFREHCRMLWVEKNLQRVVWVITCLSAHC